MPEHPAPELRAHPQSGLGDLAWAMVGGAEDMHLGPDGVGTGMTIFVYWEDLETALVRLLGYSMRNPETGSPKLIRHLPWQHPYFNQLYVKAVTSVKGMRPQGTNVSSSEDIFTGYSGSAGGVGD